MVRYLRFKTTDSDNPVVLVPIGGGIYAQRTNANSNYLIPYDNPNYHYKVVNTGPNSEEDPKFTISINKALAKVSENVWKEPVIDVVTPVGVVITSITLEDGTDTLETT